MVVAMVVAMAAAMVVAMVMPRWWCSWWMQLVVGGPMHGGEVHLHAWSSTLQCLQHPHTRACLAGRGTVSVHSGRSE
jgi:hypothetical protein